MKKFIRFFILFFSALTQADVYKCKQASGRLHYQDAPCSKEAVKQQRLPLQTQNPQVRAQTEARFAQWQAEHQRQEQLAAENDKQLRAERDRQLMVEALMRGALAQEQQARNGQVPVIINNNAYIPYRPYFTRPLPPPDQTKDNRPNDNRFSPIIDNDPRFSPIQGQHKWFAR